MSELHPSFICSTAASPCKTCFHIFSMLLSLTQMSWSMQCAAVVVQKSITLRVMSMFSEAIFRRLSMNFYYAWHLLIIIISDVTRPVKLFHSPTTVRSPSYECPMSDVNVGICSLKWWSPPLKSIKRGKGGILKIIDFPICLSSTFSSDIAPRTTPHLPKRKVAFRTSIFRFYVRFREGIDIDVLWNWGKENVENKRGNMNIFNMIGVNKDVIFEYLHIWFLGQFFKNAWHLQLDAWHFPPFPHDSQHTSNFSRSITATLRSGRSARSAFAKPQMGAARGRRVRSPGKTETPLWVRNLSWWWQPGKPLVKPKSWNKTIPPKHCMRFMMISDSSFRTLKLKVFQVQIDRYRWILQLIINTQAITALSRCTNSGISEPGGIFTKTSAVIRLSRNGDADTVLTWLK